MNLALDNSVVMRWFFGDGSSLELAYAGKVLDAMEKLGALVPVTWRLGPRLLGCRPRCL